MRFPSKRSFVRASLLLIFALPTFAHGDDTVTETAKPEVKTAAPELDARYLTLAEAQKAFGNEFTTKNVDGVVTLFGGSSKTCMSSFDVSNSPSDGTYKIFYKGDNDSCLDFSTLKIKRGEFQSFAEADAKLKPAANAEFKSVRLVWENIASSKNPLESLEIPVDAGGESISHESAAGIALRKKKEEEDKKKSQTDMDFLLVTKCGRGLNELDVGEEALARLSKIPEILKDKGDDWFADKSEQFRKRIFEACAKQIRKARTDEIASADCETRFKKIVAEDDSYAKKVKALYLEMANRYAGSETMSLEDAYTAAMDTLAKIREFDLSEKEESDLVQTERNLNLVFLSRAAKQGSDSEAFKSMRGKMLEYMLANDDVAGCLTEDGGIVQNQVRNPACAVPQQLAMELGRQTMIANGAQVQMNRVAQEQADIQGCATLRSNSSISGIALNSADDTKCKIIESAAEAKVKAKLNAGISSDGFAQTNQTTSTTTPAATTDTSGLMNSGKSEFANTATAAVAPQANVLTAAPAPTTAAAPAARRVFH